MRKTWKEKTHTKKKLKGRGFGVVRENRDWVSHLEKATTKKSKQQNTSVSNERRKRKKKNQDIQTNMLRPKVYKRQQKGESVVRTNNYETLLSDDERSDREMLCGLFLER